MEPPNDPSQQHPVQPQNDWVNWLIATNGPTNAPRPRTPTNHTIHDFFSRLEEDGRTYHWYDAGGKSRDEIGEGGVAPAHKCNPKDLSEIRPRSG
jgi:hypothetical protein